MTKLERWAAVQRLTAAGLSARDIAERVGVSGRTVVRVRRRQPVEVSTIG